MFVSDVGGTGKSFLIETTKALVNNIWPSNDLTCAIATPTGLAAFNPFNALGIFICPYTASRIRGGHIYKV